MAEHNMKPIKKGDSWSWSLSFYEEPCETTPIDVSTYVFKLMSKDSAGVTIFTWNDAIFVPDGNFTRIVSLTPATTAGYTAGEFQYELQVTIGSAQYTWMTGYVLVENQITS
jgi:hypothetical protein